MGVTTTFGKIALFGSSKGQSTASRGWAPQDIADLYRIRDQLARFGFPVVVHTGQSDEGDPWAVFERDGTDEVVVHVARIDRELVIVDVVRNRTHRGNDFRSLADELLAEAPLVLPRPEDRGNVVLHPRMVLTAFVAAALVVSEFANPSAAEAATLEPQTNDVPDDKAAEAKSTMPFVKHDTDLSGKLLSRDGVLGAHSVYALGFGGLAASFAALSTHLAFDAFENDLGGGDEGDTEARSSPDVVLDVSFAMPLLFDDILLSKDHGLDIQRSVDASVAQTLPNERGVAFADVKSPDVADSDVIIVPVSLGDTWTLTKKQYDVDTGSDVSERSLGDQGLALPTEPAIEPSQGPDTVLRGAAVDTAEVLSRVAASVAILDQSQLPSVRFDGNTEGAIVVELSEFSTNLVDPNEVSGNFPTFASREDGQTSGDMVLADQPEGLQRYQLASELSENIELASDVFNVLVYAGGDVVVSGFSLGRDRIVFLENITPPDWLSSVEIVGSDVVLLGQDGSVTLSDAVATFV